MSTQQTDGKTETTSLVGSSELFACTSRLVRKFWCEVKPCPSCGYSAVLWTWSATPKRPANFRYQCPNEECRVRPTRWAKTHEEAAKLWNEKVQDNIGLGS